MRNIKTLQFLCLFAGATLSACNTKIKRQEDKVYSRHLQEHINLTIISTPIPEDRAQLNLLLLNDGQDVARFRIAEIADSLYKKGLLKPLIVVGIHANDPKNEYGVAGSKDYQNNGSKADKYGAFINNELFDFVKKKAGIRKFKSVAIAGWSVGGVSALDIAWDHADKIDKVGVFSGVFGLSDKKATAPDYSDETNRILLKKIRSSRKKPKLKYWFQAGMGEENGDRDKDGIIDVIDDTRDLVSILKNKNFITGKDIHLIESNNNGRLRYDPWSQELPFFLIWAFGK